MEIVKTYGGELRCESEGEIVGWVYETRSGQWVAKLNGIR